jgi:CMP-N,N'-diacetyllegionaminic acid synthase
MMAYSIEAALESEIFDRVYVSTEDPEIGELAESFGAIHHSRPQALSGDLVSATDVCLEVAETLAARQNKYDAVVCLQPSSPLRSAADIAGSWRRFVETDADYLVSATEIDPHYFHWAVRRTTAGWQLYFGSEYMKERLELPSVYRPNGAVKIGRLNRLSIDRNFFGPKLEIYIMPEERSTHVATRFEFRLAEFLISEKT